ncbi:DUF3352 domain-containing protein [Trichothermofontia sp.]
MKRRSFFFVLATITAGLLLLGGGGAYAILSAGPLGLVRGGVRSQPTAAWLVAKQAPLMMSLLVNPDRLAAAGQAAVAPAQRRQVRSAFGKLQQRLLGGSGLDWDYQRDIQPWLGEEITFAVMTPDIDYDASTGLQPGYLATLATRNAAQSRTWLQRFWQRQAGAGTELVFEDYKGVTLIYGDVTGPPPSPDDRAQNTPFDRDFMQTLATAVVGDRWVLLANSPKVLRDAINNLQAPDLNLARTPTYQQALEHLAYPRIGLAYVNFGQLQAWQQAIGRPNSQVPTAAAGPRYGAVAFNLGLTRQGVRIDTALLPAVGQTLPSKPAALMAPVAALQYVPASSALVMAGTDLRQFWQQLQADLQGYPPVEQAVTQLVQNLRQRRGLDLPADIFSWVQGDYAIGLLPKALSTRAEGMAPPDWLFIAQRSAPIETAIAHLDAVAQDQGFSTGPFPLGDRQVYAWTRLTTTTQQRSARRDEEKPAIQADVLGVHTTVGEYEVFATSLEAMSAALATASMPTDRQSPLATAIAQLSTPNDGLVYLNWQQGRTAIIQKLPIFRLLEFAGKPVFDHLETLVFTSYGSDAGIKEGTAFLKLH